MLPAPSPSGLFPSFGGKVFQKNDPHKPQRSSSEKSVCPIRGKRKVIYKGGEVLHKDAEDVGLRLGLPSSLGSTMQRVTGTLSRSLPTSLGENAPLHTTN